MATMQQVADRAGVSIATVSFVVNGTKRVLPATAARVTAAMEELGYRNNVVARALASKRTRIIALMFPTAENRLRGGTLDFFVTAVERASQLGYHLVLWPDTPGGDGLDELLSGGLVDGVVLMEVRMEDPRVVRLLELDVPFVSIGRTRDTDALPFVDIYFEQTVEDGIEYLKGLGHQHLGLVIEDLEGTSMAGYAPHLRTQTTFLEASRRQGLTATVQYCGESTIGGRRAARDLLEKDPAVTGIVVMKDESVFGLMAGLQDLGRRIPEDVSVLSIASSVDEMLRHEPTLSTMVSPSRELGALATESLVGQLEGTMDELPHVLISCTLHVGESTAPAPRPAVSAPARTRRRTPTRAAGN
jgi:DNA-binding LacI/PurR family transcriptional regulator